MGTNENSKPSAFRFEAPLSAIEAAVLRLKDHGNVSPDATYNPGAPNGLRSEIAYHDEDFLWCLGRSAPGIERDVVQAAISFLAKHGISTGDFAIDEKRFREFRESVHGQFTGGWTSFTPVMERLFYTLTAIRQPSRMVEFGCFWGNTLAWFAGPALRGDRIYKADSIVGIDIDGAAIDAAAENFRKIGAEEEIQLIAADARQLAGDLEGPIDYLYLEAKEEGATPIYLDLLQAVYDKLPKGAWVIAHDIYDKDSIQDLKPYMDWVRDPSHFSSSFAFDIDFCGAELSVK